MCRRLGETNGAQKERGIIIVFYGKVNEIISCERDFLHHRILSAVKREELISDRMPYIVLRGRWCNIIVLYVHAPSEEKCDDSKAIFSAELEQVFHNFRKYNIKILLGDTNEKLG